MDIKESKDGIIIEIRANPASGRFRLHEKSNRLVLDLKSRPEGGKANMEIITGLGRIFRKEVRILRGHKSRDKTILIEGITKQEFKRILGC